MTPQGENHFDMDHMDFITTVVDEPFSESFDASFPVEGGCNDSHKGEATSCGGNKVTNKTDQNGTCQESPMAMKEIQYNSRKPKWWKQVAGRTSKAQRRAFEAMKDSFVIQRPPYGTHLDWDALFSINTAHEQRAKSIGNRTKEIWLEIGFGNGENLLRLAQQYPERCFVGAEIHAPGTGTILQRMQAAMEDNKHWSGCTLYDDFGKADPMPSPDATLDNYKGAGLTNSMPVVTNHVAAETTTTTENMQQLPLIYCNVRIFAGDGVKFLPYIPSDSLTSILVTFPDPFPKNEQREFRVFQQQTVRSFHRVLQKSPHAPGRIYLATDHLGCFNWCQAVVHHVIETERGNEAPQAGPLFRSVLPCPPRQLWLPVVSKYEQKGWTEGRSTHLACWEVCT